MTTNTPGQAFDNIVNHTEHELHLQDELRFIRDLLVEDDLPDQHHTFLGKQAELVQNTLEETRRELAKLLGLDDLRSRVTAPDRPPFRQYLPRQGIQGLADRILDLITGLPTIPLSEIHTQEQFCLLCKVPFHDGARQPVSTADAAATPDPDPIERPVRLACGHIFGDQCLKSWLIEQDKYTGVRIRSKECPVCRQQVLPAKPNVKSALQRLEDFRSDFRESWLARNINR